MPVVGSTKLSDFSSFFESIGTAVHLEGSLESIPGGTITLVSFSVPALTTRRLHRIQVTCRRPGRWYLEVGGSEVASGRIGTGNLNDTFQWDPIRDVATGTAVALKFDAPSYAAAADVEAYFMGSDIT